jgi:hypothetical protein
MPLLPAQPYDDVRNRSAEVRLAARPEVIGTGANQRSHQRTWAENDGRSPTIALLESTIKSLSAAWLLRWTAGGSMRLKRLMRLLGGSVRLKRLKRFLGGSMRTKRTMRTKSPGCDGVSLRKGRNGWGWVSFLKRRRD